MGGATDIRLPRNLVAVDCETTGLDPKRRGIVSIGAVNAAGREFYMECRPVCFWSGSWDEEAEAVHGFTFAEVNAREVCEDGAVDALLAWLDQSERGPGLKGRWIMVGKNPAFDYSFLTSVLCHMDVREVISRRVLDVHALAYAWAIRRGMDISAEGFQTEHIYAAAGLEEEPRPHHALNGARCAMAALGRFLEP